MGCYYLDLAREAKQGLTGPEQRRWVLRLDAEIPNMQAAVRRAQGRVERVEGALELCLSPQSYWVVRDYHSAVRKTLPLVLEEALEVESL